jgi:hypothetical protein
MYGGIMSGKKEYMTPANKKEYMSCSGGGAAADGMKHVH